LTFRDGKYSLWENGKGAYLVFGSMSLFVLQRLPAANQKETCKKS